MSPPKRQPKSGQWAHEADWGRADNRLRLTGPFLILQARPISPFFFFRKRSISPTRGPEPEALALARFVAIPAGASSSPRAGGHGSSICAFISGRGATATAVAARWWFAAFCDTELGAGPASSDRAPTTAVPNRNQHDLRSKLQSPALAFVWNVIPLHVVLAFWDRFNTNDDRTSENWTSNT
jgi:hypothetical protein